MYLFLNKGLKMSSGKLAAQASHAAVEAFRVSNVIMIDKWYEGKHHTKLIMQARDDKHIQSIAAYLMARGFKTVFIIDEGMNEVPPHSFTALGVEIVDRDNRHVQATFSSFKLYRETIRVMLEIDK
jgi:peptidyl-tRNA hydrolase